VCGEFDARKKIRSFSRRRALIPEIVHRDYDNGPFKLDCEDLGLANIIVRSTQDMTIVGLVDLEWSYAGPAQLSASPWWLLQSRPTLYDLEMKNEAEKSADILSRRYLRYLDIYISVLMEEEEEKSQNQSLS
jgi:hypothetical protein